MELNKFFFTYQQVAQKLYNKNTETVLKYYTAEHLLQLERIFILVIQSFAKYITMLEVEENFTRNTLQQNYTEINATSER